MSHKKENTLRDDFEEFRIAVAKDCEMLFRKGQENGVGLIHVMVTLQARERISANSKWTRLLFWGHSRKWIPAVFKKFIPHPYIEKLELMRSKIYAELEDKKKTGISPKEGCR